MVSDAERVAGGTMSPLLGGGTRLMLDFAHRVSDDIDLFVTNPQWLAYLSPRLNDKFDDTVSEYDETSSSLKLRTQVGEIDFICAPSLLGLPHEHSELTRFHLEPVAEVLAKKLFYRGWALTPRDLFDWFAIGAQRPTVLHDEQLANLVRTKSTVIENALIALRASKPALVTWNAIRAPDKPPLDYVAGWTLCELQRWHSRAVVPRHQTVDDSPGL